MPAIHSQGVNKILVNARSLLTHVGVSTDNTAYNINQTQLDPSAVGTNLIAAATQANVDNATDDYTINVTSANFGGNSIFTIGAQSGSAATDSISRSVRTNSIGVDAAGDNFNIGVRVVVTDQSA
jgi:hypothetical protein